MTTSTSDERLDAQQTPHADVATPPPAAPGALVPPAPSRPGPPAPRRAASGAEPPRTIWGRFIILMLCTAVVTTTLAFGTVHAWSLAAFQLSAAVVLALWAMDAWRSRVLRASKNFLQLPLLGLAVVGLVQLLPLGAGAGVEGLGASPIEPPRTLSFDPNTTRFVVMQVLGLLVYFAAALAFIDSPRRLRTVVRFVIIFGFVLAVYGLMQHFLSPSAIFWVRKPEQAEPFGPYINRHHFAGYMELVLALPLGLLFAGAVDRDRVLLYAFASAMMCIALVMTNSRGGMLSMLAEVSFLVVVAAAVRRKGGGEERLEGAARVRAAAKRVALGFAMVAAVFAGVLYFGGEESLSRLVGSVNTADPTTGRAHFWRGALQMVKDRPALGVGLGGFSAAYPRYDTSNGTYRLEQAHNDYLQILTDAGVVGGALGLLFLAGLFRMALSRVQSRDKFRRGVALGALAGCVGALVHSFFDFTLHATANALLFLLLAALATANGRLEKRESQRRRRRRRPGEGQTEPREGAEGEESAAAAA
ncbi:MAG TPA: O-antigen ligase family protein [Pyrinomonadaceae bacterium]|nr:O-antigen ligase family protein [Pyrinomonadaceae bacterium]